MLVPMKDLLVAANRGGYAVGAFNVNNLEMIEGVLEAAATTRSPVIIATAPGEVDYVRPELARAMTERIAAELDVTAALHLDHGDSFETAMRCIRAGYTSVMFDGSALPFADNVRLTREVVQAAHAVGVSVEGEIGRLMGYEDGVEVSAYEAALTDVDEAIAFAGETGIDTLAVAIGTAHGFYKLEPKLDFDRLARIREGTELPIVLHGGTGVPVEAVRRAIGLGIAKVNFSTRLRKALIDQLRTHLEAEPDDLDFMAILGSAKEAFRADAQACMELVGSVGQAAVTSR